MRWLLPVWILATCVAALAQPAPTIDLRGRLELVDTTPTTTPVGALTVSLYSPETFALYHGQVDENGNFELRGVRPGHYVLQMWMPSRLRTFTIAGRDTSPAGLELVAGEKGPVRIVLSMKTGALSVDVQGIGDTKAALVGILAPDDEYLTLRSQVVNPVSDGRVQFKYEPPGKYLLFVVDTDLGHEVGINAKLREALRERATRMEVFADVDTRYAASYIDRQTVEAAKRQIAPP